jgi:hypothetical protein
MGAKLQVAIDDHKKGKNQLKQLQETSLAVGRRSSISDLT